MNGVAWGLGLVLTISFGTPAPSKVRIGGGLAAESAPPIRAPAQPPAGPTRQAESAGPTVRIHAAQPKE